MAKDEKKKGAAPAKATSGGTRTVSVNFEGVEVGVGRVHIPEGDYGVKVSKVALKKSEAEKPYLLFSFKVIKGDKKGMGKSLAHNCSLQVQSLWNLRNLIESTGRPVPSKTVKLDLDKMVGWECACTVIDEEYEGKQKSVISAFFPLSDLGKTSSSGDELEEATEEEEEGTEEETTEEESEEEELFG